MKNYRTYEMFVPILRYVTDLGHLHGKIRRTGLPWRALKVQN
jgi:hypothetical protein